MDEKGQILSVGKVEKETTQSEVAQKKEVVRLCPHCRQYFSGSWEYGRCALGYEVRT